jgi:hypothetical protein
MKKLIITGMTVAMLAVPSMAAAQPDGDYMGTIKDGASAELNVHSVTSKNASLVGEYSARSTQNGQFVSGQDNLWNIDQTTSPGSRAALIQGYLGDTK